MAVRDELDDLGAETFERSDYYREAVADMRKANNRERTAERRLVNNGNHKVLHRRKNKAPQRAERMEEA